MHDIALILAQFGPAGLIGVLWVYERRQAGVRERQIDAAQRRIAEREYHLDALLEVVKDNTRAMNMLQQTQRQLIDLLINLRRLSQGTGSRVVA